MFWKTTSRILTQWRKRQNGSAEQASGAPAQHAIEAGTFSDVGCHREENEDRIQYTQPADPVLRDRKGSLAVVADGMGGHAAGEVASSLAVAVISRTYYEDKGDLGPALQRAFAQANHTIYQTALQDCRLKGMGTTCTALVLRNGSALCAHVGDSRLYLIRDGAIFLMTEDHTVVMEMVRSGLLTLEEARRHPERNILVRALGTKQAVAVSTWAEPLPVRVGDVFVLCSDGLSDLVSEEEIKAAVVQDMPSAGASLVALAKERGGYDNITVGLLSIKPVSSDESAGISDTRVG